MILETQSTAEVTPEMLAKAFWDMSTDEQSAFFRALRREVGDNTYGFEMQSHFLEKELCEEGRDALMTLAAPMFMHTLMACDKW